MVANPFLLDKLNAGPLQTAIDLAPVTPNDASFLPVEGRAMRIGTAGTLHFISGAGQERTTNVLAGETLLVQVKKVFATGTTATGIEVYI